MGCGIIYYRFCAGYHYDIIILLSHSPKYTNCNIIKNENCTLSSGMLFDINILRIGGHSCVRKQIQAGAHSDQRDLRDTVRAGGGERLHRRPGAHQGPLVCGQCGFLSAHFRNRSAS